MIGRREYCNILRLFILLRTSKCAGLSESFLRHFYTVLRTISCWYYCRNRKERFNHVLQTLRIAEFRHGSVSGMKYRIPNIESTLTLDSAEKSLDLSQFNAEDPESPIEVKQLGSVPKFQVNGVSSIKRQAKVINHPPSDQKEKHTSLNFPQLQELHTLHSRLQRSQGKCALSFLEVQEAPSLFPFSIEHQLLRRSAVRRVSLDTLRPRRA